jgi:DNA-binding SARP family transcriptional activator
LNATARSFEIDIITGSPASVIPNLRALVVANPYREDLVELLMAAQVNAGLRSEALATYRRTAHRLRLDLGVDPSHRLRMAKHQVESELPLLRV